MQKVTQPPTVLAVETTSPDVAFVTERLREVDNQLEWLFCKIVPQEQVMGQLGPLADLFTDHLANAVIAVSRALSMVDRAGERAA